MATNYGNRLREAREFAGLTQKQAEKKTGIAQSTISTAERLGNGSADTPLYADAYGVDALWLATGEGDMILTTTAVLTSLSPTVSATGGPGGTSQDKTDIAQALTLLGQVIAASDKLTRAQIKPILDQLLESPEQAQELGQRLQATVAINQGVPAMSPQITPVGGIAGKVLAAKPIMRTQDLLEKTSKNS